MSKDRITVNCFALRGFGNDLLLALSRIPNVKAVCVYTRKSGFEFPYYQCETIEAEAEKLGVPVRYIPEKGDWDCDEADLALLSTYHRIFKRSHLERHRFSINIHPSLLPDYRGATPTNWAVRNGEKFAGLTAYLLEEGIDEGEMLFQRKLLNPYLCDHQLRKALSFASQSIVEDITGSFPDYAPSSTGGHGAGSYQPARAEKDSVLRIEDAASVEDLIFHIKAFTNFPMPKLEIDGKLFVVDYENPEETASVKVGKETFEVLGYWSKESNLRT